MKSSGMGRVAGVILLALTAFSALPAADVFVGTPTLNPASGQLFNIQLLVDVGAVVLGSYFFEFSYDPAVVHVNAVQGGTTAEFSAPPVTNPATFTSGTTPLAAAQGGTVSPSGFLSVATLTLQATGLPADSSDLGLDVQGLFDAQTNSLSASVFPSSVLIAVPEIAFDVRFTNLTTIVWTAAPTTPTYDVYRGTLANGPKTFNHVCHAADLTSPTTTETTNPPLGQAFYFLVAAERNGVEGPLGLTSAGQVRPNFFSCSTGLVAPPSLVASDVETPRELDGGPAVVARVGRVQDAGRIPVDGLAALRSSGDVTGDGRLSHDDVRHLLEAVVGARRLSRRDEAAADADGNGRIEAVDAQMLMRALGARASGGATHGSGGVTVVLGSADCRAVDLASGLNDVRLRCLPAGYSAFRMLEDLGPSATGVQRFDPLRGGYDTARTSDGSFVGDDFPIHPMDRILVELSAPRGQFLPRP